MLDIDDRTLVNIHEQMRITDDKRLRALMYLVSRGATIRLLGDLEQLPAIGAVVDAGQSGRAQGMFDGHAERVEEDVDGAAQAQQRVERIAQLGVGRGAGAAPAQDGDEDLHRGAGKGRGVGEERDLLTVDGRGQI
ncbi:hypothetical protein [Nocardia wallacei]|uniref:hypothetical protein n=1 Tax=Nocardia wallacei TaxID=480035 RepID=UPI003CC90AEC